MGDPCRGPGKGPRGWGYRRPEKQPGSRLPALPVLAGTSCLGYLDENGSWHPGFSCPAFTFCCGTCHRRYCCGDLNLLLPKWQQKHCQGLRWAGLTTPHPPLRLPSLLPCRVHPHSDGNPGLPLGDEAWDQGFQEQPVGVIRCLGGPSVPGPSGSPPLGPVRPCGARTRVTTQTAVQFVGCCGRRWETGVHPQATSRSLWPRVMVSSS